MISEDLRKVIKNQYREYGSYRQVARLNGISEHTVNDLHKRSKRKHGPKPKITERQEREMIRTSKRLVNQGSRIQRECNLYHVATRTIRTHLVANNWHFKSASKKIVLTSAQKEARLRQAREWISGAFEFSMTVFTDEKRFCADGPDNFFSYMSARDQLIRNKRQQGGPSVQVWGALLPGPYFFVVRISNRMDSKEFMQFLEDETLPHISSYIGDEFILQQDQAPTHTSAFSKARFAELGVDLLPWPLARLTSTRLRMFGPS